MMEATDRGEEQLEVSHAETRSNGSATNIAAVNACVKVEIAHADYAKMESQIMIEKALIEARLKNFMSMRVAEVIAEANIHAILNHTCQYMESQSQLLLPTEDVKQSTAHIDSTVHVLRSSSPPRQSLAVSYDEQHFSSVKHEDSSPLLQPSRPKTIPSQIQS